jgi:hypothetical protein
MATRDTKRAGTTTADEPTKAELQRQMDETRESISETVDEIKETVAHQYETVKETYETVKEGVGEVMDWREQFSKNPIVWGAGAVSLGVLVGIGMAHSLGGGQSSGRRNRQQAALSERLLEQLSSLSETMMPTITSKIKEMFGIDLSEYLSISGETVRRPATKSIAKRRPTKKSATGKSSAKKRSTKQSGKAKGKGGKSGQS